MEAALPDRLNSIFAVESLRAGVPTRLLTRELPDMRKNIMSRIRDDLESFAAGNIPQGRLIWGQYGQGKTHVLTTAEHTALDMGFAVSRISLSREVSCHNLYRFYGRVAPAVRTPDSTVAGLQHRLYGKHISELPETPIMDADRYVHPLPAIIFEDYFHSTGEEQDRLYSDLTGIRIPMAELKRIHKTNRNQVFPKCDTFRINEHASAYFGVMADAIKFCGYRGWVILVDEIELVGRLGKISRLKAYMNLNWMLNWSEKMKYPVYTLAAAATRLQDDIWYGKKDDDRTIMPQLAGERYGEEAGKEMSTFFTKAIGEASLKVAPVTEQELAQLLDRIAILHAAAYEWSVQFDPVALIQQLGSQTIRTYIRAALETLDLQYLYGDEKVVLATEKLREQTLEEDESFFSSEVSDI